MQCEPHVFQISGTGLGEVAACRDSVAYTPPQIELVARLSSDEVRAVVIGLATTAERAICGLFVGCELPSGADIRIEGSSCLGGIAAGEGVDDGGSGTLLLWKKLSLAHMSLSSLGARRLDMSI